MEHKGEIIETVAESGYTDLSEVRRPRKKEKKDKEDSK